MRPWRAFCAGEVVTAPARPVRVLARSGATHKERDVFFRQTCVREQALGCGFLLWERFETVLQ